MKTKVAFSVLAVVLFAVMCGGLIFAYNYFFYPLKYKEEILSASQEFNVKPEVVASIINAESKFKKDAISNKGAVGLMQVLPTTANWVAKKLSANNFSSYEVKNLYNSEIQNGQLFNPKTNIRIGTCYFGYLLQKFKNLNTALCAYNAGEGTVLKWLSNPEFSHDGTTLFYIPYNETRNYVNKVNINLKIYKKKFN